MTEPTPGRRVLDDLRFELKRGDAYEQHLSSRIEDGLDSQTVAWEKAAAGLMSAAVDGLLVALEAEGVVISADQRRRAVNRLLYGVPYSPAEAGDWLHPAPEIERELDQETLDALARIREAAEESPRPERLTDRIEPEPWVREPSAFGSATLPPPPIREFE
jgi:hypothetical protein